MEQLKRGRGRPRKPATFSASLAQMFSQRLLELRVGQDHEVWPSEKYQADPVAFVRDILAVEPWDAQVEILEAVRDHKRVAVASGHKVGKSATDVMVALWFYCSFPDARVVMTSVTSRQVDQILWRELRMLRSRALKPIDGEMHELARSGLKSMDFREIVGFTAKEAEAVAGISGKNLLYIVDEASGVAQEIFDAIEGNRAGGARILLTSNPTRAEGEFYDAFYSKKAFYKCIQVPSTETPNCVEGRDVIPGLATRAWIDEKRQEWGEQSALYKIRVLGQFVLREDGKVISAHTIQQAEDRWADMVDEGELSIGIDPAGEGPRGDETVFAVRRGKKIVALHGYHGVSRDAHLIHLLSLCGEHKHHAHEKVCVNVDREGKIGNEVWYTIREYANLHPWMHVYGIRCSEKAMREPLVYDRLRDELWANLAHWLRDGGAIPEDTKLAAELHAPEYKQMVTGKLKVTDKDTLRKHLERSPDRADAVALAVWHSMSSMPMQTDERPEPPGQIMDARAQGLDPYEGMRSWGKQQ